LTDSEGKSPQDRAIKKARWPCGSGRIARGSTETALLNAEFRALPSHVHEKFAAIFFMKYRYSNCKAGLPATQSPFLSKQALKEVRFERKEKRMKSATSSL
jgi:hypothetical protein